MTEILVELEQLLTDGKTHAQEHFAAFVTCVKANLPESMWHYIPTGWEPSDLEGIWSRSVKWFPVTLFGDLPDYQKIDANFAFTDNKWHLEYFTYNMGIFSPHARMDSLVDAVLVSRMVAKNASAKPILSQDTVEKARLQ